MFNLIKTRSNHISTYGNLEKCPNLINRLCLYSDIDLNTDSYNILIHCNKTYGYGDVSNAYKTKKIISKHFKNVFMSSSKDDKISIEKFIGNSEVIYDIKDFEKTEHVYIVICALQVDLFVFKDYINLKGIIFVSEYNSSDIRISQYPIEKSTKRSIRNFSFRGTSTFHYANDGSCMELRSDFYNYYFNYFIIPSNEFLALSGGLGLNDYNVPTIGIHILEKDDLTSHLPLKKYKLKYYFAYSSPEGNNNVNMLENFVDLVVSYEKIKNESKHKFVIFVTVGHNYLLINNIINKYRIKVVKQYEKKFSLINKNVSVSQVFFNNIRKNVLFLHIDKIDNHNMLKLMIHSNPMILLTGDQSLAEGISLTKFGRTKMIFYQLHDWKKRLFQEYIYMIGLHNSDIANYFIKLHSSTYYENDKNMFLQLVIKNYDKYLVDIFNVHMNIIENYNIKQSLLGAIKYMMMSSDDVNNIVNKIYEKINKREREFSISNDISVELSDINDNRLIKKNKIANE